VLNNPSARHRKYNNAHDKQDAKGEEPVEEDKDVRIKVLLFCKFL
jgi:hypothetical protein